MTTIEAKVTGDNIVGEIVAPVVNVWTSPGGGATLMKAPYALAFNQAGDLFVADFVGGDHSTILRVKPDGTVSKFVGSCPGYVDGAGYQALFGQIFDLAVDENDNVPDYNASRLRTVAPDGTTRTIAIPGNPGVAAFGLFTEPGGKIYFASRMPPQGPRWLH